MLQSDEKKIKLNLFAASTLQLPIDQLYLC